MGAGLDGTMQVFHFPAAHNINKIFPVIVQAVINRFHKWLFNFYLALLFIYYFPPAPAQDKRRIVADIRYTMIPSIRSVSYTHGTIPDQVEMIEFVQRCKCVGCFLV